MKKTKLFAIGASLVLASAALADAPAKMSEPAGGNTPEAVGGSAATMKPARKSKPANMTCEDFLALDDVARPKLVYWAEGVNNKGKPEDAIFDVETTDTLVPVVIEDCKSAPKDSFWKRVRAEFKKAF